MCMSQYDMWMWHYSMYRPSEHICMSQYCMCVILYTVCTYMSVTVLYVYVTVYTVCMSPYCIRMFKASYIDVYRVYRTSWYVTVCTVVHICLSQYDMCMLQYIPLYISVCHTHSIVCACYSMYCPSDHICMSQYDMCMLQYVPLYISVCHTHSIVCICYSI